MDYWDLLQKKMPNSSLSQRESIGRLNRARVNLKHHGILPSSMDIESFRACSTSFFEENTPIAFGVRFDDISMVNLVRSTVARGYLETANRLMGEGKYTGALGQATLAFTRLVNEFEGRNRTIRGISTLSFRDRPALGNYGFEGVNEDPLDGLADEVGDAIEDLQEKVAIIGLGLDYSRYLRFRLLTKDISVMWNNDRKRYEICRTKTLVPVDKQPLSADDCRFCIDFVVELALHIQGPESGSSPID